MFISQAAKNRTDVLANLIILNTTNRGPYTTYFYTITKKLRFHLFTYIQYCCVQKTIKCGLFQNIRDQRGELKQYRYPGLSN